MLWIRHWGGRGGAPVLLRPYNSSNYIYTYIYNSEIIYNDNVLNAMVYLISRLNTSSPISGKERWGGGTALLKNFEGRNAITV